MQSLSFNTSQAVQDACTDLERLQGVWASVAGRRQTEILIAGNSFTVKFLDGKLYMGSFHLEAGESPRVMIMRIDEGPLKHRGKIAHCIYELHEETLRWCPTEPGSDDRLTTFPGLDDEQYLCLVFHRETPRRRGTSTV
jgi:uncharacterized protein (TIGR03067 family)